jgi:hypothetical protein
MGKVWGDVRPGHLFVSVIPLEQDEVKRHCIMSAAKFRDNVRKMYVSFVASATSSLGAAFDVFWSTRALSGISEVFLKIFGSARCSISSNSSNRYGDGEKSRNALGLGDGTQPQSRLTALLIYSPPALLHFAVGTHTPGAPFLPVQGPFSSDRRTPAKGLVAAPTAVRDSKRMGKEVSCMLGLG